MLQGSRTLILQKFAQIHITPRTFKVEGKGLVSATTLKVYLQIFAEEYFFSSWRFLVPVRLFQQSLGRIGS